MFMSRLSLEEDIVREVLDDFSNDHESPANDNVVFGKLDVNMFRLNHSRRDEAVRL